MLPVLLMLGVSFNELSVLPTLLSLKFSSLSLKLAFKIENA